MNFCKGKSMYRFLRKIKNKIKKEGLGIFFYLFQILIWKWLVKIKYRYEFKKTLNLKNSKARFERIYNKKLWGKYESVSGYGSTLESTYSIRNWLLNNIPKLEIKIIVDAPCGDFFWMKEVISKVNIVYKGYDIVSPLIESNKRKFGDKDIYFELADISKDKLSDCDLLIVRDCLFHLSYRDLKNFIKNIHSVNFKYLMTTNYRVDKNFKNKDIQTGDFRMISLFIKPFNFDKNKVFDTISENKDGEFDKELLVFEKKNVPADFTFN